MNPKPKTTKNKKNLALIRSLDCFVCGARPVDVDHILTRGSGHGDDLHNLQALCRPCHVKKHSVGLKSFLNMYYSRLVDAREKYDLPPMQIDFIHDG